MVADAKQRRRGEPLVGRERVLVGLDVARPFWRWVINGERTRRRGADEGVLGLALGAQYGLVGHNGAADQIGFATGLLVLVEEVDGIRAADAKVDGIDIIRQFRDYAAKVARAEWNQEPLPDFATSLAEIDRKAEEVRVAE